MQLRQGSFSYDDCNLIAIYECSRCRNVLGGRQLQHQRPHERPSEARTSGETFLRAFLLSSLLAAPYVIHSMDTRSALCRGDFDLDLMMSSASRQQNHRGGWSLIAKEKKALEEAMNHFLSKLLCYTSHETTYLSMIASVSSTASASVSCSFFGFSFRSNQGQCHPQRNKNIPKVWQHSCPKYANPGPFFTKMPFWRYCHHDERDSVNSICLKTISCFGANRKVAKTS